MRRGVPTLYADWETKDVDHRERLEALSETLDEKYESVKKVVDRSKERKDPMLTRVVGDDGTTRIFLVARKTAGESTPSARRSERSPAHSVANKPQPAEGALSLTNPLGASPRPVCRSRRRAGGT